MEFSLVDSLDEKAWGKFVAGHPKGNIFLTPEMFQVFSRTPGYTPILRAAVDAIGRVQAILVTVLVTIKKGPLRHLMPRSLAYGSLLCSSSPEGEAALESLLRAYNREAGRRAVYTELHSLSGDQQIKPVLKRCGFAYEDQINYLIDLKTTVEQGLQRRDALTGSHTDLAYKRGCITIEEVTQMSRLADWFEIVQKTPQASHMQLASLELFESAFQVLKPKGRIKFWIAHAGPFFAAASVELLYKDVIYGWYGGVNRDFLEEMPGEVLVWRILEWGAQAGYKTYDFGGAGKLFEEYGVRDFSARFGGRLVCLGGSKKIHSPILLRMSEWGYPIYQKIIGLN